MKGQIFILSSIALAIAIFTFLPMLHGEIYLPKADSPALENIASEYNSWIAQVSISDRYNPLAFGQFVKNEYPYVDFCYILADKGQAYQVNFFDHPINISINGNDYSIAANSSVSTTFHGNITVQSEYRNFTYEPKSDFSGAIFLQAECPQAKMAEFRVFR